MDNSVSSFFEEDHDRLDALFTRFLTLKCEEPGEAIELLRKFTDGLLRHIEWEEQILFPLFEANVGHSGGPTEVMRLEHSQIKQLLERIRQDITSGTDSAEYEQRLLSVLGEHNWKEENILYPAMDNQLTSRQLAEVFDRINATI